MAALDLGPAEAPAPPFTVVPLAEPRYCDCQSWRFGGRRPSAIDEHVSLEGLELVLCPSTNCELGLGSRGSVEYAAEVRGAFCADAG